MNNGISRGTVIRTAVLALALINQLLSAAGLSPIPLEDGDLEGLISGLWTAAAALVAWWKNNSFTRAAILGDRAMARAKEGR